MNKIQIKNITKKYNNLTALDDVSFSFEFGKIYGLLGRNGAGKSTLINIIANRIFADEGMILVDDIPAKENMQVHEKVFCMSEADLYDKDLKIKEHFRWINRFLPETPDIIYGLKGGLEVYGSMHNVLFGLCAAGIISCLIRKYL